VSIFVADEQTQEVDLPALRALAELVVAEEGFPESSEVTVLLVSDDEMGSYNERFLTRSGPTDVLAFPVEDLKPGVAPERDVNDPPLLLGDIIVAPEYILRQAEEYGVTFDDEMSLMVVHGLLHLLGYDHQTDDEAEMMETRERQILAKVGKVRR
jgi:probable rRNA maturation factor